MGGSARLECFADGNPQPAFQWWHTVGEQGEEARKMMEDQDKLVKEIFAHEDKDKDGLISHDEFSGPKHDEL